MDERDKKGFMKWASEEMHEDEHGSKKREKRAGGNWIQGAIKHPGALHKKLHVPEGTKIPTKKINKATHSSNPTLRKEATLAKTLSKLHKG